MTNCGFCQKTAEQAGKSRLRLCLQCYGVSYCGPECQAKHWKVHKPTCKEPRHTDVPIAVRKEVSKCTKTTVLGASQVNAGETSLHVAFDRMDLPDTLERMRKKARWWLVPMHPHRPRALAGVMTAEDVQRALGAKKVAKSSTRKTIDASGGGGEIDVVYHYDTAVQGAGININASAMQFTGCLFDTDVIMQFV